MEDPKVLRARNRERFIFDVTALIVNAGFQKEDVIGVLKDLIQRIEKKK